MVSFKRKRQLDSNRKKGGLSAVPNNKNFISRRPYKGTNDSAVKVILQHGKFIADNRTLEETAMNNRIVRIPLFRHNLKKVQRTYKFWVANKIDVPRKRGRPPKSEQMKREFKLREPKRPLISGQVSSKLKRKGARDISKNIMNNRNIKIKIFPKGTGHPQGAPVLPRSKLVKGEGTKREMKQVPFSFKNKIAKKEDSKPGVKQAKQVSRRNGKITDHLKEPINEHSAKDLPVRYYLQIDNNHVRYSTINYKDDILFDYKFSDLVNDMKDMALPSPTWKIKVMVKKNKITGVIFSNKLEPERSVSFSADKIDYTIVIDGKPAFLLGSPGLLCSANDIEVLLDIIQNIDSNSPIILYT